MTSPRPLKTPQQKILRGLSLLVQFGKQWRGGGGDGGGLPVKSKDLLLYCRAPGSRGGKSTINTFHGSMTAGALCVCEGFAIVLVFFLSVC